MELVLEKKHSQLEEKVLENIARKIFDRQEVFKPGNDTYAMAYKSFHDKSSAALDLSPREIFEATQAVFFVSGIQLALIYVIFLTITDEEVFTITMPSNMTILAARFVCSILMFASHVNQM